MHYLLSTDSYGVQSKLTASTKFLSKQNPLCARQRRRIQREYRTALVSSIPTRCHRLAAKGLSKPVPIDTGTIVRTQWNDCHFHPRPSLAIARRMKRPRHLMKRRFLSIFLFARMWTTVPRCAPRWRETEDTTCSIVSFYFSTSRNLALFLSLSTFLPHRMKLHVMVSWNHVC